MIRLHALLLLGITACGSGKTFDIRQCPERHSPLAAEAWSGPDVAAALGPHVGAADVSFQTPDGVEPGTVSLALVGVTYHLAEPLEDGHCAAGAPSPRALALAALRWTLRSESGAIDLDFVSEQRVHADQPAPDTARGDTFLTDSAVWTALTTAPAGTIGAEVGITRDAQGEWGELNLRVQTNEGSTQSDGTVNVVSW